LSGYADDDQLVIWTRDDTIFAVDQISYEHKRRIETNDIGTYDVIIESATEADQGLYQCQVPSSGLQASTYLWVDGKPQYATRIKNHFSNIFRPIRELSPVTLTFELDPDSVRLQ